ncbi:hypothetical protein AN478_09460 [Thiohalorhabdus denitrificans]|uniref:Uncharacterized membrane protein n=1 Tax=Thiohalorhabdus denitrificans TaxID=381306 RepID=A0A0P9C5K6_9GAMM|nr:DUF1614 domain-containing protein [Thiohalorhabdus denitrificans]KPV40308.1 hypothetical protein AN478_09460 [Thiohalorhabdus denitrificans]SCX80459.1 Uncharacterized membrane protein [Thiohalorhabdus denitrificans]
MPFSPLHLLLFVVLAAFLLAFIQVGVLTIAVDKLGLPMEALLVLLFGSLLGSGVNLPLFSMRAEAPPEQRVHPAYSLGLLRPQQAFRGRTLVAVNLGGCLIPVAFSVYLWNLHALSLGQVGGTVGLVAAISYLASRPVPGLGIAMPLFIAPLTAAVAALLLGGAESAPLAYIGGTLGVLIGADLLRIGDIRKMGSPLASIGGAGTFDGIYLTGIVAVLLA